MKREKKDASSGKQPRKVSSSFTEAEDKRREERLRRTLASNMNVLRLMTKK
ncbi:MAG: hypothetical protein AAFY98_11885 [Verrucomicrobiota bacterium]